MRTVSIGLMFLGLVLTASCQKCKECYYTYTETTIEQGINGEETTTSTETGYLYDDDGNVYSEECVKSSESFSIETAYELEGDETELEDYEYTCTEY